MYHLHTKLMAVPKRYLFVAAVSIFTIYLFGSGSAPNIEVGSLRSHLGALNHAEPTDGWMSKGEFVNRALEKDIHPSAYNGSAVRQLCSKANWRDDRVMSCDMLAGGIGNLKVGVLACARYAIESGAMLVRPVIRPRISFEKMQDSFGWDVDLPLSYMFDSDHFYTILSQDCPQLRFVDDGDPTINIPPKNKSLVISPKHMMATDWGHVLSNARDWRLTLDRHIDEKITKNNVPQPTGENPIRLSFDEGVAFSWPVAYDSEEFREDWGHLALFPKHIRELSARALYNLYQMIGVRQSPTSPSKGAFLGAHIRAEDDVKAHEWTGFETQSQRVRDQIKDHELSTLFVASGTITDAERLRKDVAGMQISINQTHTTGVTVLHKWDLLEDEDLMVMDTLTWDQMGVIDFDIMLRASRFVGIFESSWSWAIALQRHAWSNENPYDYDVHPTTFEDDLSVLCGPIRSQVIVAPCVWL